MNEQEYLTNLTSETMWKQKTRLLDYEFQSQNQQQINFALCNHL